jgi:RNA polymerase sigma factor (sigma-70 family)
MKKRPGDKVGSVLDFAAKSVLAFRLTLSECENSLSTSGTYGESPEVLLQEKQSQKKFRDLIATLPEKERLVIEEYYFNDKSLSEIAEENEGLSKSWVSRLHARGIDHLLEKINDSKEEETT